MIVLTTPTGTIGHQVVDDLLESDEALRVIVRDPLQLSDTVRERVEVVLAKRPQEQPFRFNCGASTHASEVSRRRRPGRCSRSVRR